MRAVTSFWLSRNVRPELIGLEDSPALQRP